jgi:hypothetical protein
VRVSVVLVRVWVYLDSLVTGNGRGILNARVSPFQTGIAWAAGPRRSIASMPGQPLVATMSGPPWTGPQDAPLGPWAVWSRWCCRRRRGPYLLVRLAADV